MKHTLHHFLKQKSLLLPLVFLMMLLAGQRATAQIWFTGANMYYYNLGTDTYTLKAAPPFPFLQATTPVFDGTYLYVILDTSGGLGTGRLYKYNTITNTYSTTVAIFPYAVDTGLPPKLIYHSLTNSIFISVMKSGVGYLGQYHIATNTWTYHTSIGLRNGTSNNNLLYTGGNLSTSFAAYDPTTYVAIGGLAPSPSGVGGGANRNLIAAKDGSIYRIGFNGAGSKLGRYDPSSDTWTIMPSTAASLPNADYHLTYDGNDKIYANSNSVTTIYEYTISTSTWVTLTKTGLTPVKAANGEFIPTYAAVTIFPCAVTATATATQATCTAGVANSDAKLDLTTHAGGGTKVGYSIGSSYTGPAFATATTLTAAPFAVATGLANPPVNQPYTIRIYKDATCYKDFTVLLERKKCITADLAVTVASTPQTANQGETLTYTVTVTNNGPDTSPSVMVDVPIPANVTYLNGTASQGSYSTVTKKWTVGSMANAASNTLVLSLKVN